MACLENRLDRRSFVHGRLTGVWAFVIVLGAWVVVACAPAADPPGATGPRVVELEVGVATDCEAGVDVAVVVDGAAFSFAGMGLGEGEDPELPFSGTVRVPGRRGAPYRVTVTHGCGDVRRVRITTVLAEGGARTSLTNSTALGTGPVEIDGSM